MVNDNLQSSIVLRIFDILGIFSKDMPDVRNDMYLVSDKTWAGQAVLDEENTIIFLYSEKNDNKYMIARYISTDIKGNWFNLVSIDEEDTELNKMYLSTTIDDNIKFRNISYIEIADAFKGFEIIRQCMPVWTTYSPTEEEINYLSKFISSIEVSFE